MLNNITLMGRLTKDVELKTTQSGTSVTSFTIAVERSYAKPGEERKADFITCVAWRNTAEFIARYFGKGALIGVQGSLQSRSYQDKDGNNRQVVEVLVDQVSFTGEKREDKGNQQDNSYQQPPQQNGGYQNNQNGYQQPPQQNGGYQNNQNGYQQPPQQNGGYQNNQNGYQQPPQQQGFPDESFPEDDDLPF